tara:strand:+ start:2459 stop:2701 length:243 start_codon:yes stop_codon:yes gene_type:complete
MNGEEITSPFWGLEPTEEELERERRMLHNKASDYLDELEMKRFETASRVLQLVIVDLIDKTGRYSSQIDAIKEHLDKTPL